MVLNFKSQYWNNSARFMVWYQKTRIKLTAWGQSPYSKSFSMTMVRKMSLIYTCICTKSKAIRRPSKFICRVHYTKCYLKTGLRTFWMQGTIPHFSHRSRARMFTKLTHVGAQTLVSQTEGTRLLSHLWWSCYKWKHACPASLHRYAVSRVECFSLLSLFQKKCY